MKATRILTLVAVVAALLAGLAGSAVSSRTNPYRLPGAPSALIGGAASIDGLLVEFLDALARSDARALDALRVNEAEYRGLIVPGSVEAGRPPQVLSEEASEYFWETLHTKSSYGRQSLLSGFGGRRLEIVSVTFEKGVKQWANHRAHRRLRLVVRDESGEERELATGSIAELDGRFKFISFIRD